MAVIEAVIDFSGRPSNSMAIFQTNTIFTLFIINLRGFRYRLFALYSNPRSCSHYRLSALISCWDKLNAKQKFNKINICHIIRSTNQEKEEKKNQEKSPKMKADCKTQFLIVR